MVDYWCHQCNRTVNCEADQTLRCSRCQSEFIEEITHDNMAEEEGDGNAIGAEDFIRVMSNLLSNRHGNQADHTSNQPGSPHQQNTEPGPSRRGNIIQQIFNDFIQPQRPNTSQQSNRQRNNSNSNSGGEQNMANLIQSLLAHLSSGSNNGATIQVHFGGTPLHGSINDYVFGEGAFENLLSQLMNQAEAQQKGLNEEDLKSLEKTEITQENVDNGAQCTTCMENFSLAEPVIKLPCGHFYHEQCIIPWLKKNNTCPICRKEVPSPSHDSANKKPSVITDIDELD